MEDCDDKDLPTRRQVWLVWRDACEWVNEEIKKLEEELIEPTPQ